MLHTEKTDQAYKLLKSYEPPDQEQAVDNMYIDILANTDHEGQAVLQILGLITDGLRYGNWFWNMPPNEKQVLPSKEDILKKFAPPRPMDMP